MKIQGSKFKISAVKPARLAAIVLLTFLFASPGSFERQAVAQQVIQKIEALVNDEVISAFDVRQRMGLVVAASGGLNSQEEVMRLQQQVLRALVDERLQIQEAREYEVTVPDAQINDAYSRIAQSFNQRPEDFEGFLIQFGASKDTLINQLRAEFAWQALVRGRLAQQISVTDEEVDAEIARMTSNTGKYEYRVSEIYMIVGSPPEEARIKASMERLAKQIADGAAFNLVARQFSEAASAARGGDMGWLSADQMQPLVSEVVTKLELLDVSDPVRTAGGFRLLALTDRRRILSLDPLDTVLDIHHVMFTFDKDTTTEMAEAWIARAEKEVPKAKSCDYIETLAKDMGVKTFGELGKVPLRGLATDLRDLLDSVPDGSATQPIASQDGIRIFFVCGRTEPEIGPPDFDEVFTQLQEQRLSMVARRYLRDLRRDSIVDYR
ncbi:MAG: peptidylprolyl isomerase [Sphingomonadales bacterium]